MPNVRMSRVDAEIQKAVAKIINDKLEHPSIKGSLVTILKVDTTADFLQCTIFVSVYGKSGVEVVKALNDSKTFIRHELAKSVRLRTVPDLKFVLDTTLDYAQHMNDLFEQIK